MTKLSHYEFTSRTNPPVPCDARHLASGGYCLNCGWNRNKEAAWHVQARTTKGKWRTINIYETQDAALKHLAALGGVLVGHDTAPMYRLLHESELDPHKPAVYFPE